ncbi:MAG TPA: substrate-binding domain-containing protein [Spirochaetota bacterium]|nr:substrate-binding domain-containing protein [Spirochaetota bacterium]
MKNDRISTLTNSEQKKVSQKNHAIGVLLQEIESSYNHDILNGIMKVCAKTDSDLFIFVGSALKSPHGTSERRNIIYDIAEHGDLDGYIISTATIGHYSSEKEIIQFVNRFSEKPSISIGNAIEGISSIIINNYHGQKKIVEHLIKTHKCKQIAYITGGDNVDSTERFKAFNDAMIENGLSVAPELVHKGDFYYFAGEQAVHSFINSGIQFDAIVAANDPMALAALFELQRLGYKIPEEVKVSGFDNSSESLYSNPPLSTVTQPTFKIGKVAATELFRLLNGNKKPEIIPVSTTPVIRESCGCNETLYHDSQYDIGMNYNERIKKRISEIEDIPDEVIEYIQYFINNSGGLLDKFFAEDSDESEIISEFISAVYYTKPYEKVFACWTDIVSIFEEYFLNTINDFDLRIRVRFLFQRLRAEISGIIQKEVADNYYYLLSFNSSSRTINEYLLLSYDLENIKTTIENFLPNAGIDSAHIALYRHKEDKSGITEKITLFLSIIDGKRTELENSIITPNNLFTKLRENRNKNVVFIIEPLYFNDEDYGFIIYEHNKDHMIFYGNFTTQICSVLKEYYTFSRKQDIEKELKITLNNIELVNTNLSETINSINSTKQKLIDSEKLATLGSLVAGIAHEVNTPLGTTLLTTSHLSEITNAYMDLYNKNKLTKNSFENLIDKNITTGKLILDNLMKASDMINNFKQIAVDQTHFEAREFSLREYLNSIIQSLNSLIRKTSHTVTVNDGEDVNINGYPGAFSQIITNLITNALTHAFENKKNGEIIISYYTKDDNITIEVSDNGCGIPKENIKKIYSPFYTTKKDEGGSGLGLQICYNLVTRKMNGTIECESQIDLGTKFTVIIPRDHGGAQK